MKKQGTRLLSLLLSFVMVLGMLPAVTFHAHAAEYTWNPDATMTLTSGGVEIEPDAVIETEDTKLKVYTLHSTQAYTLTTSPDNDYAVRFDVEWDVVEVDEHGFEIHDIILDLTMDNVAIRTYNPRAQAQAGRHAAMMFNDENWENLNGILNLTLEGENTIELMGTADDTANDAWSAVAFHGPNTCILGDGTLNAICTKTDAVGTYSGVYTCNSLSLNDTTELNITTDVYAASGNDPTGDGLYVDGYDFLIHTGTSVSIDATGSGIKHSTAHVLPKWLDDLLVDGDLQVRAADYGISWQGGRMLVGNDVDLTVTGPTEGTAPEVGLLLRRDLIIGENCNIRIDALREAISCRAVTTANPSVPVTVGTGSKVELTGSVEGGYTVDCGIKLAGTNNVVSGNGEEWFGETWRVSSLTLEEDAEMIIHAGKQALRAACMELKDGSSLKMTTAEAVDSDNVEEYASVYLSSSRSYVRSGAELEIHAAGEAAVYGFAGLELQSADVLIHGTEKAVSGTSLYRGTDPVICTFESEDGVNWIPFSGSNSKPYLTTTIPDAHICAASRPANTYSDKVWTPVEGEEKHRAACVYCGGEVIGDCRWDDGVWKYISKDNYVLKFECEVCEYEKLSDVPYHNHAFGNWDGYADEYGQNKHKGVCTVDGCEARTEEYCSNSYGEEYHISLTTLRKDCTKCDNFSTRQLDDSAETEHYAAKAPSCSAPGNVEYWVCGHCDQYYADEACTQVLSPTEVFLSPVPHDFEASMLRAVGPRACTVCGTQEQVNRFEKLTDDTPGYDRDGYFFIVVGEADGRYYAMGNTVLADGSRAGVELPADAVDAQGVLTVSSVDAEFMRWVWDDDAFLTDGGYFSLENGRTYVYDIARKNDPNNARPARFDLEYYYEDGLGSLWASPNSSYNDREYLTFDPVTKNFVVSDTEDYTLYLYGELCDHTDLAHIHVPATCTEQGIREHWSCPKCGGVYSDAAGTGEIELPDDYYDYNDYLLLRATGHHFTDDVCDNCGMERPVYTQVPSLEAFDQLSEDTSYIIVFKDGSKIYAAYLPDYNGFESLLAGDADGDGLIDLLETDENSNEIPDIIETYIDTQWGGVDYDEDGTTTAEEYREAIGWMDEDEDVDIEDCKLFFRYNVEWYMRDQFEMENCELPNIVEVTPAEDGSITITDEEAMEFQMMEAGVWGGQPALEEDLEYDHEYFGILDSERIRAAWIPNYWIANSGLMGAYSEEHFMTQQRWYGDSDAPGVIDNKNWKISFNEDGTALLVCSWTEFDNTGALQLAKYINTDGEADMTIVGLPEEQWQYSDIMLNRTDLLPAYLYASEPAREEGPHEHDWSAWTCDNEDVHIRRCTDDHCDAVEVGDHTYESTVIQAPNCTTLGLMHLYCPVCGDLRENTMPIDPEAHDWGEWIVTTPPTLHAGGEETRTCRHNAEHMEHRGTDPVVCRHICAVCGGCSDSSCAVLPKCACNAPDILPFITLDDTAISYIPEQPLNIPAGQTVSIVAAEVQLPSASDNAVSQPVTNVNPYEEFILNNAEGMKVETVFEIGLVVNETGAAYEMEEGESAQVRLFVGRENAQAIEEGRMFLIHITNGTQIIYGAEEIEAEKDGEAYTGYITFKTDSFSPFVLVSLPDALEITLNGKAEPDGCTVSVHANQAYRCRLSIAVYDADGKMLAMEIVDSCNLAANPQYTLEFTGTASYVKAFMMEVDGGFIPRNMAAVDSDLSS